MFCFLLMGMEPVNGEEPSTPETPTIATVAAESVEKTADELAAIEAEEKKAEELELKQEFIAWYVHSINSNVDCHEVAALLMIPEREFGLDALAFTAIAKGESTFKPWIVNSSGHSSLLQISTLHKGKMRKCGLKWGNYGDWMRCGCLLFKENGWGPWAASKKTWKPLYPKLKAMYEEWKSNRLSSASPS